MKKTICIDGRMALHSGIGTYIRNLVPFMEKRFHTLYVLAPVNLMEKWPVLSKYNLVPVKSPLYSIQEQLEIPLRIPRCDVYWTPHYNIPWAPIPAKLRLSTIHDVYHLKYGATLAWHKRYYAKCMINQAVKRSDHVFTISQFSKDEINNYVPGFSHKITFIHNGMDEQLQTFSSDPVSQPGKYFLFVSNLAPHKNVERLLRAWQLVSEKYDDWSLILVGKKVKNEEYLKVLDEHPSIRSKIRFLGQVPPPELATLYQNAYATLAPSLYEGFGLTPLEAMHFQCPTIVSNCASLPEVCGEASLYVNPFDIHDIAQKISTLIENPPLRHNLIEKGQERIKLFRWERAAMKYIEQIERLL